jgi:hypothetical protein
MLVKRVKRMKRISLFASVVILGVAGAVIPLLSASATSGWVATDWDNAGEKFVSMTLHCEGSLVRVDWYAKVARKRAGFWDGNPHISYTLTEGGPEGEPGVPPTYPGWTITPSNPGIVGDSWEMSGHFKEFPVPSRTINLRATWELSETNFWPQDDMAIASLPVPAC